MLLTLALEASFIPKQVSASGLPTVSWSSHSCQMRCSRRAAPLGRAPVLSCVTNLLEATDMGMGA